MSYIDNIFARTNIQQFREFLMHGVECAEISPQDYKQRIAEAWEPVTAVIRPHFSDQDEYEKITNEICAYASVTQDVYMEIGTQCGVILAAKFYTGLRP